MAGKNKNAKTPDKAGSSRPALPVAIFLFGSLMLPVLVLTEATMDPAYLVRHLILTMVVVATSFLLLFSKKRHQMGVALPNSAKTPVSLGLLAFVVVKVASISMAVNAVEAAFDALSSIAGYLFFLLLTAFLKTEENAKRSLLLAVAALNIILLGFGLFEFMKVGFDWQQMGEVGSQMVNQNLFAPMFFLCIPFLLMYHGLRPKFMALIVALIVADILMITALQNRATYLALLMAVLTYVGILSIYRSTVWKGASALLLAGVVSVGLYQVSEHGEYIEVLTDSHTLIHDNYNSTTERLQLWNRSALLFKDSPIPGIGAGNWPLRVGEYGITDPQSDKGSKYFLRPHNEPLKVLSELGLVGISVLVVVAFLVLRQAIQSIRTEATRTEAITILAALVGLATVSILSFPMERVPLMVLVFSLMALLVGEQKNAEVRMTSNPWPLVLILVFASISTVAYYKRMENDIIAKRMDDARNRKNWTRVADLHGQLAPTLYNVNYFRVPNDFYSGLSFYHRQNVPGAKQQFISALKANPNHILTLTNLATCYQQTDRLDSAIFYYTKALTVNPNFETARLNLAIAYYREGKIEAAHEELLKCNHPPQNVSNAISTALKRKRGL